MATRRRSEDQPAERPPLVKAKAAAKAVPAPAAAAAPRVSRSRSTSSAAAAPGAPQRSLQAKAQAKPGAKPGTTARTPAPAPATPKSDANKPQGLWRAGLQALDNVRHDVQRRQANVIETLLGIAPPAGGEPPRLGLPGLPGLDALGLRKFEDVFDQRVAAALERLGMPSREEIQALHDKLDQIHGLLARMEAGEGSAPAASAEASARAAPRKRKPQPR